jgi:lipoprotein-releasing system permease protein
MFKPFYAFVGSRYTRVKRKNHFISFISLTSVVGIALGVAVLITVLSVMNGFNTEIRAQMLNGTPHITVGKTKAPWVDWKSTMQMLSAYPNVSGVAPFIYDQGMLASVDTGRVSGALVKGVDPNQINEVYPLAKQMKHGDLASLKSGEFNIVLGKVLANNLGVMLGDKISLIVPDVTVSLAGISARTKRFTVTGIFEIGALYDGSQVFINLDDADKIFRMQGGVSGLQLKLKDELDAPNVARALFDNLNQDHYQREFWITDWTQEFGSFFKALKIQKTVMTFILLLIITVAVFNLVSSLVMIVTDKRQDIAILRTLGASRRHIMGIFIFQGSIIGTVGMSIGVLLGLCMANYVTVWADALQSFLNVELVSKDVYLVGFLPSEIHKIDVLAIAALTLLMSLASTLYPAWRAASIRPAEALRYE